jgi:hypothetical protein
LVAVLGGLAACTVLTSETPHQLLAEGRQPVGVLYSLPLSVIDLTLAKNPTDETLLLHASNARSIADPHHRYVLRYRPLPNYDDTITMAVNPSSFLKKARAETEDRTPQIIVNFVKLFGRLSGGLEEGELPAGYQALAKVVVIPTDDADLERGLVRLNQTLLATVSKGECKSQANDTQYRNKSICLRDKQIAENGNAWLNLPEGTRLQPHNLRIAPVQFWIKRAPTANAFVDEGVRHHRGNGNVGGGALLIPRADCTVGICYRSPLPYHIWFSVGSEPARDFGERPGVTQTIELMPNEAELVEIDIRRTFFAKKVVEINFDKTTGFLSDMQVEKDAELVAVAKLPVQILKAMLSVLKFRTTILTQQANIATEQAKLIEARRSLAQQQRLIEGAIAQAEIDQGRAVSVSTVPVPPPVQTSAGAEPTVKLP